MVNVGAILPSSTQLANSAALTSNTSQSGDSFANVLGQLLNSVTQSQQQADQMGTLLATGQAPDLHTVMIDTEKAQLALQLTVQVRNKVVDAYQEIMRMQI